MGCYWSRQGYRYTGDVIKAKNAEQLNEDSIKVRYRESRGEFELRINCKNKDLQLSGYRGWDQIVQIPAIGEPAFFVQASSR